jgi:hypothetical protein
MNSLFAYVWRHIIITMNFLFDYVLRRQTNASSSKLSDEAPPSPCFLSPSPVLPQQQQQDVNTSFSSRAELIQRGVLRNQQPTRYDFDPIIVPDGDRVAGTEVVLPHQSNHLNNMSATSQSIVDHDSLYGNSRAVSEDEADALAREHTRDTGGDSALPLNHKLLHQMKKYQRFVNEELLVAALERLQDDIQLVADVQDVFGSCNEPPMDKQDGFLTGFASDTRGFIVRNLDTFLMVSSRVPGYAETHEDLREALFFCLTAVRMAVPMSEKEQNTSDSRSIEPQGCWQLLNGLRATIGIIPPESPKTVRGGDTSVFSLPSDSARAETPMTSNVSLTTTITSAVTTPFKDRARNQRCAPNGLQLRRTIEILSTILHKMAVACVGLSKIHGYLGNEATIRLIEDIKRNYLQLLAVKQEDVKALVNAFELHLPPLAITREVSTDAEDEPQGSSQAMTQILPPSPPILMRAAPSWVHSRQVLEDTNSCVVPAPCNRRLSRTPYRETDLFSLSLSPVLPLSLSPVFPLSPSPVLPLSPYNML